MTEKRMTMQEVFDRELHDLCQPLTTMQCRFELAQMMGDSESLRDAVRNGIEDCARIFKHIGAMRERLIEDRRDEAAGR